MTIIWSDMEKELIYFALFLILAYIFILMVLRAVYFTFVLKKEPLQSLNIVPKIKFKVKKGSVLEIAEKEKKQEEYSKWA
ncbi:MAG: hypothetical protein IIY81_01250 [Lachnospiraceae bacterium]|nr:hypothetical protein [Lachnospiraceae bacterium]